MSEKEEKRSNTTRSKTVDSSPIISIITLNGSGPNAPIKRQKLSNKIKKSKTQKAHEVLI